MFAEVLTFDLESGGEWCDAAHRVLWPEWQNLFGDWRESSDGNLRRTLSFSFRIYDPRGDFGALPRPGTLR